MHSPRSSRALIAGGIALATIIGAGSASGLGGVNAGSGGPRIEASLTDATAEPAGAFVPVSPLRVLDTRPAPQGPIGVSVAAPLGAGQTIDLPLAGNNRAIPASATSALLNVTIDADATTQSFLTVYPTGEQRPFTSANNALPGLVASNSIVAKLGTNGSISIYNQQGAVNVVVDLVGYLVPLDSADAPGAQLSSGSGAPSNSTGNDGDFYVDTENGILYGPRTNGVWPTPGVSLGGAHGAASGYNEGLINLLSTSFDSIAVPFAESGPQTGSVAHTDADTFTVSADGVYSVEYHLGLSLAALGTISVLVDGVQQGPSTALTLLLTGIDNTVLVEADAGDTIELVFTPTSVGVTLGVSTSSIIIEQVG